MGDVTIDDVADFFSRPIAFHRSLARVGGGITSGLLLSQAVYWQRVVDRKEPGAWWYKTSADWLEETGLTREEFQTARRRLVDGGVLEYEVRGMPAKGHYRVSFQALLISLRETRKLDYGNPEDLDAGKPQALLRESRSSLTTENSKDNTEKRAAERRCRLPKDFVVSERVKLWYVAQGFPPGTLIEKHFETFLRKVRASGFKYVDWDEALMNAIADDWGDVRRTWLRANGHDPAAGKIEWWQSADGVAAMAVKLNVERVDLVVPDGARTPLPWEQALWFKARVCAAAGEGPWNLDRSESFQHYLKVARAQRVPT